MRTRQTPRLILLICTLLLTGCGQTGPLYLPEPEPELPQEHPRDPGETDASPVPDT
jgi:predicted small lipoprotein YifL